MGTGLTNPRHICDKKKVLLLPMNTTLSQAYDFVDIMWAIFLPSPLYRTQTAQPRRDPACSLPRLPEV